MDALKQAVRTILAADATLVGLVGDKIRPDELHEGDALPAIIFEIPEEESQEDLADTSAAGIAVIAVSCCAHTAAVAGQIAARVKMVLAGYRGDVAGVELDPVTWQKTERDQASAEDAGDDADWWVVSPVFSVWYRE